MTCLRSHSRKEQQSTNDFRFCFKNSFSYVFSNNKDVNGADQAYSALYKHRKQ